MYSESNTKRRRRKELKKKNEGRFLCMKSQIPWMDELMNSPWMDEYVRMIAGKGHAGPPHSYPPSPRQSGTFGKGFRVSVRSLPFWLGFFWRRARRGPKARARVGPPRVGFRNHLRNAEVGKIPVRSRRGAGVFRSSGIGGEGRRGGGG